MTAEEQAQKVADALAEPEIETDPCEVPGCEEPGLLNILDICQRRVLLCRAHQNAWLKACLEPRQNGSCLLADCVGVSMMRKSGEHGGQRDVMSKLAANYAQQAAAVWEAFDAWLEDLADPECQGSDDDAVDKPEPAE